MRKGRVREESVRIGAQVTRTQAASHLAGTTAVTARTSKDDSMSFSISEQKLSSIAISSLSSPLSFLPQALSPCPTSSWSCPCPRCQPSAALSPCPATRALWPVLLLGGVLPVDGSAR